MLGITWIANILLSVGGKVVINDANDGASRTAVLPPIYRTMQARCSTLRSLARAIFPNRSWTFLDSITRFFITSPFLDVNNHFVGTLSAIKTCHINKRYFRLKAFQGHSASSLRTVSISPRRHLCPALARLNPPKSQGGLWDMAPTLSQVPSANSSSNCMHACLPACLPPYR